MEVGQAGVTAGPFSSSVTMWYHSLVIDGRSVHTHTLCACLWFSKFSYTWSVPTTGMGGKLISVELKDSPTPTFASDKDPRGHTVQGRVPGLSFGMIAIGCSLSVPV